MNNYSVFLSRIEKSIDIINKELKKIVKKDSKVLILPWAFPNEINSDILMNDFFKKGNKRYNRYVESLKKIGIDEKNIIVGDCYKDKTNYLKQIINKADILLLPGGNPEMFYSKVVQLCEILYNIKHFKGIIIGESAGAELQLKRYFIMKKNNYYKYFAFYDGFGVIEDLFYLDVHSTKKHYYINKLQKISDESNKKVYAIFDDGAVIFNRDNKKIKTFGNVLVFKPSNKKEV